MKSYVFVSLLIYNVMYCSLSVSVCVFFFFFKQKTSYEMRISDWISDVCSSDLKNIRSHAICLNLHVAAQIAAIHGVVCYAVTNQIAVKSEVGDLMCNAEPPTNSGVAAIHINRKATFSAPLCILADHG